MPEPAQLIQQAIEVLKGGGIVAYPAEACFGLGCLINNQAGIKRIRMLKDRPAEQGLIVVADQIERVQNLLDWTALSKDTRKQIQSSWPGATTWLIPALKTCPSSLTGQHDTLALRIPAFKPITTLCAGVQSALVSTSANLTGELPLKSGAEVQAVFDHQIDYVLDLPIQGIPNPSKIIDARTMQTIRAG